MLNFLRILFAPLVPVYALVIKVRNYLFDNGYYKTEKVNAKVISIGNITVGGSGKTPTVLYVTGLLKNKKKNVGILSRGYLRKTKGYHLVSMYDGPVMSVEDCGDEIYLEADELKVPTAVSEKRVPGAKQFIKDTGIDTIVLDDAYQHRWIERDLNILVFDQRFLLKTKSADQGMLPLGLMREPFTSVNRSDLILINRKFSEKKDISPAILAYFKGKEIFYCYYAATGIYDVKNHQYYDLKEFKGQKSLVICGIAKPYSFLKKLEENNIDISNKILFNDHKYYSAKDIEAIRKKFYSANTYSVITTQKDAVKLSKYSKELDDIDIYYLKIELVFEKPEEFEKKILEIY